MKTLYIECAMGAAGDMLMAALSGLIPDTDAFIGRMNALLPGVRVERMQAVRCGITGHSISVRINGEEEESHDAHAQDRPHDHAHHDHHHHAHDHEHHHEHAHEADEPGHHHHAGMADIEALIGSLPVSEGVRRDALAVYALIAEAEAHAHGKPVELVHFHEVGALDAVCDIVGVCLLMEEIAPDHVVVSPVHVGSGQVRCAHGILPVPAPATAHILRAVPTYGGAIQGELCTPTGAALLKHFAERFGPQPAMAVEAIGYGMGKKEFPAANCVRAMLGTSETADGPNDSIAELQCNLDDMTGEALAFAQKLLMKEGALDAYAVPILMKKGRPGQMLCCLCREADADKFARLLLEHTTTLGVRRTRHARYALSRESIEIKTKYGTIRVKESAGYGVKKCKAEHQDIAKAARRHGIPLETVREAVQHKVRSRCEHER